MQRTTIGLAVVWAAAITAVNTSTAHAQEQYDASSRGTRLLEGGNGFAIKMLVERSNLGRRGHVHGTVEIF